MRFLLIFLSFVILCFGSVACNDEKVEKVQNEKVQPEMTKEEARKQFYDTSSLKKQLEAYKEKEEKNVK